MYAYVCVFMAVNSRLCSTYCLEYIEEMSVINGDVLYFPKLILTILSNVFQTINFWKYVQIAKHFLQVFL